MAGFSSVCASQNPGQRRGLALKSNSTGPRLLVSGKFAEKTVDVSGMSRRQTRIAILDDDQSVRTAISRLLKASEMATEPFANCVELFTYLKYGALDCLVLDLQMPGMDGIDVLRNLKQRGESLPVVMITAHDAPGTRENCISAGAAAYVRKPLDVDALLDAITLAMNGGTQQH